jgi:predicted AlkP superfamily pyrophosphatase or phosphodiesterase
MTSLRRLQIVVLVDALGWSFIKDREFLTDILPFRRAMRTVLGFSSGAIPTILTGLPPAENGHWNLFYYDPMGSPFRWLRYFQFLPDSMLDHRVTRKLVKELGRRVLGLGPLFECCVSPRLLQWFNWVEKRNIYGPKGIVGAPSIFDRLIAQNIPYRAYSYHDATDSQILDRARKEISQRVASFYFLYLSEMDMFLHMHCNEPKLIEERLHWYDRRLREVFEEARRIDAEASFLVISDHGMTPVRNHYDLVQELERRDLHMPQDYLAVYDSTMARFWFFDERVRRDIFSSLTNVPCGRWLSDSELRQLGVYFPDHRYGEAVFLLDPGWLVSRGDFNGPGWKPCGMHGYHPDDPYSDAIFLSNHEPSSEVRTVNDVYLYMDAQMQPIPFMERQLQ